jgi:murein DD-endopeptidase MepM/ murein hydrolase activator NlpD
MAWRLTIQPRQILAWLSTIVAARTITLGKIASLGLLVSLVWLWPGGSQVAFGAISPNLPPSSTVQTAPQMPPSQQMRQQRDRLKQLERDAQADLNQLKRSLKTTNQKLHVSQSTLTRSEAQLQRLERNLEQAEAQYRQRQGAIVQRLQWLQRQPDRQGLALLLQSDQLTDWLDRRHRIKRLYESERNALVSLKQQTDRLDGQRNQVEAQKNQIMLLNQQLLAQRQQTQVKTDYQKQAMQRLTQDRRALEAALNQLTQDSSSLSGLIRQRVSRDRRSVVVIGSGHLSYPIDAPVTSDFGWRVHPILGTQRFHGGIDFGADYGTVIRATAAGTVIYADWYGGFGYTVILDHGNGITTLYAHCDGFYVEEGQSMQKGEPIAAVGSTGFSTGPHLHFEVRDNGEPIDPAPYL